MCDSELSKMILSRLEEVVRENQSLTDSLNRKEDEMEEFRRDTVVPSIEKLIPLFVLMLYHPEDRISQIKTLRTVANLPLKEAKKIIDEVWRLVDDKKAKDIISHAYRHPNS